MEQFRFNNLLLFSKKFKENNLVLENLLITNIPDLSQYLWVFNLNIDRNKIMEINKKLLPPKLDMLEVNNNLISDVIYDDMPETLTVLHLMANNLTKFDGSLFVNLLDLNISYNDITHFKFPPNIVTLDLSNNSLTELDDPCINIEEIDFSHNQIIKFPKIIDTKLKNIFFNNNSIEDLPIFPKSMILIKGAFNIIKKILNLPSELNHLDLDSNEINSIECPLPKNLNVFDLSNNLLEKLPEFPESIEKIFVISNKLTELNNIPNSVKILNCKNNNIQNIPHDLLNRKSLLLIHEENENFKKNMHRQFIDDPSDDEELAHLFRNDSPHRFPNYGRYPEFDRPKYNWYNSVVNSRTSSNNPNYISFSNKKHIIL